MKKRSTRNKRKTKKTGGFRGKIKSNANKRKSGSSFGHIKVPNRLSVFIPEPNTKVVMDILPYTVTNKKHMDKDERNEIAVVDELWYKAPYRTHGGIGAGQDKVVCPSIIGKKCPICEHTAQLRAKNENGENDDAIKALKLSNRNLYVVLIKSIDGKRIKEKSVQLFDFSDYLFQEKFESQLEDDKNFEIFPDIEDGCSLKVVFGEGSYSGHKYPDPTRFDFVERAQSIAKYEKDIPELDECLDIMSYKELKEKFNETNYDSDDDDDEEEDDGYYEEDEDEDEAPRKRKSSKFVADDEDEDEDDEDYDEEEDDDYDDEEEDEDEHYDDDDEDEDEDEDEEEEEPVKRRKRSSSRKKINKKPECDFGHRFGRDYDRFDDCDDCSISKKCKAAKKKR